MVRDARRRRALRQGERRVVSAGAQPHLPRVGCGAAIVIDGRLLLTRRLRQPEAGCWGLPGGKVDPFEPVTRAVEREIAEELGVAIEAKDLLCVADQIDEDAGEHWVAPVYLVRRLAGEPRNLEPDKHSAIGWFALDQLPQPLTRATIAAAAALNAARR